MVNEKSAFDPAAYTAESVLVWNETAEHYEKLSNALFIRTAEQFVDFAGVKRGQRVLDLACGPGLASRAAARKAGESGSVLAADLAPGMIARAAAFQRTSEAGIVPRLMARSQAASAPRRAAPIEWAEMDAHALPLPDASFDAAISQLGLMLFARPDAALAEMTRVTKPGGVVACLVQGRREKMLFTSLILHALIERAPDLKAAPGAPTLYAFGPDGILEAAFARAGLRELSTKRLTGTFHFASPEDYWTTMIEGAGRTGAMLRGLSAEDQAAVKKTVLRRAAKNSVGSGIEVPYEFMMARGYKAHGP